VNVAWIFDREQELQELRRRLSQRKRFLFHGPSGAGKTLLLQHALADCDSVLYCAGPTSPQAMFRDVAISLVAAGDTVLSRKVGRAGAEWLNSKSATSIKGIVLDAFHAGQYSIVLDQLERPSQAFAAAVREVMGWGDTPIVAVARSAHMEDAGFFLPFFPDRSDKFELRNLDSRHAEEFTRQVFERAKLNAGNKQEFFDRVLEVSRGNPGAILSLVQMATHPKYLSGDHIKIAPLYIDFRLNWKPPALR
jgi:hypothetical protein